MLNPTKDPLLSNTGEPDSPPNDVNCVLKRGIIKIS